MGIVMNNKENLITINSINQEGIIDHIPAQIYKIGFDPRDGEVLLFKHLKRFDLPKKRYGRLPGIEADILETWRAREQSTGVLLDGRKGSGKTMLGESLSNNLIAQDIPVFLVDKPIPVGALEMVLGLCPGGAGVFFDEYGKNFDMDDQQKYLELFSNSSLKKVLFILTKNQGDPLDDNYLHRPGRILFNINHEHLDMLGVCQMLDDVKCNKDIMDYLVAYIATYSYKNSEGLSGACLTLDIVKDVCALAEQVSTVEQFQRRLMLFNLPQPIQFIMIVTAIIDEDKEDGGRTDLENSKGTDFFKDEYEISFDRESGIVECTLYENGTPKKTGMWKEDFSTLAFDKQQIDSNAMEDPANEMYPIARLRPHLTTPVRAVGFTRTPFFTLRMTNGITIKGVVKAETGPTVDEKATAVWRVGSTLTLQRRTVEMMETTVKTKRLSDEQAHKEEGEDVEDDEVSSPTIVWGEYSGKSVSKALGVMGAFGERLHTTDGGSQNEE